MPIRRIVMKFGTQVLLASKDVVGLSEIGEIAQAVAGLKKSNFETVIVSSGAIGLGAKKLNLKPPCTLSEKQACASVGQGLLMKLYEEAFGEKSLLCGQILITSRDLTSRTSFLNLKDTFETLLKFGAIPIINENDSVSVDEILEGEQQSFGDNDKLSAIVSSKINADLLIIFTDVDGVYKTNPKINPQAERFGLVENIDLLKTAITEGKSDMGRGGMAAKIEAARTAAVCGVAVLITSVKSLAGIARLKSEIELEELAQFGTLILSHQELKGRKKWIGTSSGYKGVLTINEGAQQALVERGASLLAVGVTALSGDFESGDVVSVRNQNGDELGRGVARLSKSDLLKQIGSENTKNGVVVIHRDNLAVFVPKESE